jgi:exosome complex exonuclease DIS3/RRP44
VGGAQVDPGEHYGDDAEGASDRRPTGAVVGIIRRNWRTRGYAGSLQPPREGQAPRRGSAAVLFCPVERRFPFIRIQTRQVRPPRSQ